MNLPEPTPSKPFPLRKFFYVLGCITIIAASFHPLIERVVWTLFGVAFIIAADAIKDVEKAKWKERQLTEIRMKQEMLEGFEKSLDARYKFTTEQIANAFTAALGQLSTYVKDASPTRSANLRITPENDDEK